MGPYFCTSDECCDDGYRCPDGRCVTRDALCNGVTQCGDCSDETFEECTATECSTGGTYDASIHLTTFLVQYIMNTRTINNKNDVVSKFCVSSFLKAHVKRLDVVR